MFSRIRPLPFLFLIFICSSFQKNFSGKVTAVIDGDTIEVLKNGKAVRIRLSGIDCPEKSQAFGARAKQFTASLIFNKNVTIKEKELDRYGRTIADVYLEDGKWLNLAIVEAGLAWHYKKYSNDQTLAASEIIAKKGKIGLWNDQNPVPPWSFRRNSTTLN